MTVGMGLIIPTAAKASTINVPADYATIQAAINAASPGDTINVAAGTYAENIVLLKSLTLLGPNANVNPNTETRNPEAVWQSANTGKWPLRILSLNDDGKPAISNVVVKGFRFLGRSDVANTAGIVNYMQLVMTNSVTIENNIFADFSNGTKAMGIYKVSGSTLPRSSGWLIKNNRFVNFSAGPSGMQVGSLTDSSVTGNVFVDTYGGIDVDKVDNFQCSGNALTNIAKQGINLASSCWNVTISNNSITKANTLEDNKGGIYLYAGDFTGRVTVTGNTIINSFNGVAVQGSPDITGKDIHVNFNSFTGNTNKGIYFVGTGNLDATNNWWGANNGPGAVGPGSGDKATANVSYDPWLIIGISASPTSIVANGTSTSTITADMTRNSAGNPSGGYVPNDTEIIFTTDKGSVGSLTVNKTTTSGKATATLTSSNTAETATISAKAPGDAVQARVETTVNFVTGAPPVITLTANPISIVADGTSTSTLTATVKDQFGRNVADGTDVVFTTSKGTVGSSTVTKPTTGGVATATLTSVACTQTVIADVSAATNGVSKTISVFFTPPSAPPITSATTDTVCGCGIVTNTTTGGSIIVDATGDHAVTTARYGGNPGGTPSFNSSGNYYDVHIDKTAGLNSITIQFSPATASTIIYYWTGTAWKAASNQTYAGGIVTVTVTATTFPNLADLSGLFLGSGTPVIPSASASINTTLGTINFNIDRGYISNGAWLAPADIRCYNPAGYIFPYGMFSFDLINLTPGQVVNVTIRFPNPLPLGTRYYKCINGSMTDCTPLVTRVNEYTLILTFTDGGPGDADGLANGIIAVPGGPAFPLSTTPASHQSSMPITPQAPVMLSNITVKSASLSSSKVAPGAPVTITADVANTGKGNGTSVVKVYVNGSEEASQGVTVNSGGITQITFNVTRNEPGTYSVYVGGTPAGSFTVDLFTPDTILVISSALVFFAFVLGVIYMMRRRQLGY